MKTTKQDKKNKSLFIAYWKAEPVFDSWLSNEEPSIYDGHNSIHPAVWLEVY